MKKIIEFLRFDMSIRKIKSNAPDISKFKALIVNDWGFEASLRCKSYQVRDILPLESLRITHEFDSLNTTYINFDRAEFKKYFNNKSNKHLLKLCDKYFMSKIKARYQYYFDNHTSLLLMIDVINSKYHLDNENEVMELLKYLIDEFETTSLPTIKNEEIRQRMKLEMEFINLQKEKKEFKV